jgi:hypothetical protein
LRKAIATGLPMAADCVGTSCKRADVNGRIGVNFDKLLSRPREPKAGDAFHYTVAARAGCVNPPEPCTRETEALEAQCVAVER